MSQATPLPRCHMESSTYMAKEAHTAIIHIIHTHTQEASNFWAGMPLFAGTRLLRGKNTLVNNIVARTPFFLLRIATCHHQYSAISISACRPSISICPRTCAERAVSLQHLLPKDQGSGKTVCTILGELDFSSCEISRGQEQEKEGQERSCFTTPLFVSS